MAQHSGFFNALKNGNIYDRKYNADDYSRNLAAFISTGVRRGNNELYVQSAGGMALKINTGYAMIEGKWYENDTVFTDFVVPTAPTGDRGRVDRVILRRNDNVEGREITLVYLTGTPALEPVAPALTRDNGIYEIALADIAVNPNVTEITQSDIYDRRAHKEVCGWVTSPIGYDDYFANLDAAFETWFAGVRNTLAATTIYQRWTDHIVTENLTNMVTFNIPQYDPSGVDVIDVYVNGLRVREGADFTINGSVITFTEQKIAGTEIDVVIIHSIDGTGLGTVADKVDELEAQLATVKNIGEYIYICNGSNDNKLLSDLAQEFLNGGNDNAQMIISVYGKFGATATVGGGGLINSRARWFDFSSTAATSRKIIFDFEGCSGITLNCEAGTHYLGFYGQNVIIKNANVTANCRFTDSSFQMLTSVSGGVSAEGCRFWISGYSGCLIADTGTFTNCRGEVTNSRGDSFCFNVSTNGLLRVNGGEYYAYTGQSANNAAVVYIASSAANGAAITYGMNCPTAAKDLHYQKNAVLCNSGYGSFSETITELTVTKAANQNVRGTIPLNRPNRT